MAQKSAAAKSESNFAGEVGRGGWPEKMECRWALGKVRDCVWVLGEW
jgi:hypothetical protein